EIGTVAPVLTGAEEEHLYAALAALMHGGKDVGLLDALRIDRLIGSVVRERREAVAVSRSTLELHLLGRFLHEVAIHAAHVLALAAQEADGLVDELAVIIERDLAGARGRTALDLMQQARARAAFVDAIGAGAQQERALQHVDG